MVFDPEGSEYCSNLYHYLAWCLKIGTSLVINLALALISLI